MGVTYVVHVPGCPILPAEVDERVVRLLDVHLTFAFVRGHGAALHGHLTRPELHQVLDGGAARPRHQAGEQSSRGHDAGDGDTDGGGGGGGLRKTSMEQLHQEEEEKKMGNLGYGLKLLPLLLPVLLMFWLLLVVLLLLLILLLLQKS